MHVLSSYHPLAMSVAPEQQTVSTNAQPEPMAAALPISSRSDRALTVEASSAPHVEQPSLTADAASMKYRRSERTSVYIKTQEGDVVRLKFRTRDSVSLRSTHVEDEHGELSELTVKTRSATKLSLTVKGDLNADELAAIQDTIDQAGELAEDFFAGDVRAAFESAAALDIDGSQLARVKLKMKTMERLTYSARTFASGPSAPGGASELDSRVRVEGARHGDPEAGAVVASESKVPQTGPSDVSGDTATSKAEVLPAISDEVEVQPAMSIPEHSGNEVFRLISNFLTQLSEAFGPADGGSFDGTLDVSLKLRLFESSLVTLSEMRENSSDTLPSLVHETIDALVAQEQAPMDEVA